jgi:hypothetical protein
MNYSKLKIDINNHKQKIKKLKNEIKQKQSELKVSKYLGFIKAYESKRPLRAKIIIELLVNNMESEEAWKNRISGILENLSMTPYEKSYFKNNLNSYDFYSDPMSFCGFRQSYYFYRLVYTKDKRLRNKKVYAINLQ